MKTLQGYAVIKTHTDTYICAYNIEYKQEWSSKKKLLSPRTSIFSRFPSPPQLHQVPPVLPQGSSPVSPCQQPGSLSKPLWSNRGIRAWAQFRERAGITALPQTSHRPPEVTIDRLHQKNKTHHFGLAAEQLVRGHFHIKNHMPKEIIITGQ